MEHLRSLKAANLDADSLVTIGVFDGVHRGHQQLIQRLVKSARATGRKAVALSFHPHPDTVLERADPRHYLTTPEKRAALLLALGVDLVVTHPFDAETRQLPAAQFIDRLIRHLRIKEIWVGADFALGFQREGDVGFLRALGAARGFEVKALDLLASPASGERYASSTLRGLVRSGDMRAANAMLGRAYALEGEVIAGERRGRTIGVPTANIEVWREQIIPANGVYASWARLGAERFAAATNIGTRPTVAGENITIEAHLLDFDRDIYGERLEITFEARLRPERKFGSLDELARQIKADIALTRRSLLSP